jgi:hypothetical protein
MGIVILYNSTVVNKEKCPDAVKYSGTHIPMKIYKDGQLYWDYQEIKKAIG